jgi:hypothetical protein
MIFAIKLRINIPAADHTTDRTVADQFRLRGHSGENERPGRLGFQIGVREEQPHRFTDALLADFDDARWVRKPLTQLNYNRKK